MIWGMKKSSTSLSSCHTTCRFTNWNDSALLPSCMPECHRTRSSRWMSVLYLLQASVNGHNPMRNRQCVVAPSVEEERKQVDCRGSLQAIL
jgi:hypothetical protein